MPLNRLWRLSPGRAFRLRPVDRCWASQSLIGVLEVQRGRQTDSRPARQRQPCIQPSSVHSQPTAEGPHHGCGRPARSQEGEGVVADSLATVGRTVVRRSGPALLKRKSYDIAMLPQPEPPGGAKARFQDASNRLRVSRQCQAGCLRHMQIFPKNIPVGKVLRFRLWAKLP